MFSTKRDDRLPAGRTGRGVVAEALLDPESQCFAHALNLCEVFYDFHRASGQQEALEAISDLTQVGVTGTLKANLRRVSLADCFAIELAERLGATILTADHHEFDVLAEQSEYAIRFIR